MKPKELKHMAPTLASLQEKGNGFSYPKDYFEQVESRVMDELFLTNLPENIGYSIPNDYFNKVEKAVASQILAKTEVPLEKDIPRDYFENFEDKLFNRLTTEKETKVFSLQKYWLPVAIAASLLLFVSIYNPFKKNEELSIAEIEAWIEEGNLELNVYEIANLYDFEIENVTVNPNTSTNNIEEYLLEEIDESVFYN